METLPPDSPTKVNNTARFGARTGPAQSLSVSAPALSAAAGNVRHGLTGAAGGPLNATEYDPESNSFALVASIVYVPLSGSVTCVIMASRLPALSSSRATTSPLGPRRIK
jgi:hypothetical protein